MGNSGFHSEPYDDGTLTKLDIFELYAQEWIPVFTAKPNPLYPEVHIFDFFCGPGTDSKGNAGSPLRILRQLRNYLEKPVAGWNKVRIVVHLFDLSREKILQLSEILTAADWKIPGVTLDVRSLEFTEALKQCDPILTDRGAAKLLIIDQFGVDGVTAPVFRQLIGYPTADFIFFLSSSTLNRFRNHTAIKIKIDELEDSYDVHRAAFAWFKKLAPIASGVFLGQFSIKKRSNIYGLIFGSRNCKGILKFLRVAWEIDSIGGEANFDIERENLHPDTPTLPFEEMRPKKIQAFETQLREGIRSGVLKSESDLIRFCIEAGMTCKFCAPVIRQLKAEKIITCSFRTPNPDNYDIPRLITLNEPKT
ncbi:MAG: three-Cys-motif partner protein TcmP [Verrucomicrobia bacterium]|nr:three-Cys-motif partner protein TcmP [Verrucomicrobiota bacterium]